MSSGCQWSGDEIREYRGGGCVNVHWTVEKFGMAAVDRCFGWNSRAVFTSTVNRYPPNIIRLYTAESLYRWWKNDVRKQLYISEFLLENTRSRNKRMSNIVPHARKNKFLQVVTSMQNASWFEFHHRSSTKLVIFFFQPPCVPTPVCTFRIT